PGRRPFGIEDKQFVEDQACRYPGEREHDEIARKDQKMDGGEYDAEPPHEDSLPGIPLEIVTAVLNHDGADEGDKRENGDTHRVQQEIDSGNPGQDEPVSRRQNAENNRKKGTAQGNDRSDAAREKGPSVLPAVPRRHNSGGQKSDRS